MEEGAKVSLIQYLNDPSLVARFQRYFGVHCESPTSNEGQSQTKEQSSQRILRSTTRKCSSWSSGVDADFDFDTKEPPETLNANLLVHRGSSKHTRNESSGSSGVSSGTEEDDEAALSRNFNFDKVVTNKFWYFLFKFGTALGDEAFYACWFSFWFWNVDGAVGRRVVMLWGILMYIGQGLKDIIRWPRPSCPPVVRLERKWEMEYGMPSTHAVVGAAVPFATIIFTSSRYEYPMELGVIGALLWCTMVCLSRLYLGMHSVLDIVAGLGLVITLFVPVIPVVDWLDPLVVQNEYGGIWMFLVGVVLCFCTPGGDRWSPARSDTFVILGSTVGLIGGAWLNFQFGVICGPPMDPPYAVIWPSYSMLGLSLLRLVIGLCMIVAIRAVTKATFYTLFHRLLRIPKAKDLNTAKDAEIFAELSQKYLSYVFIGLTVTCFCPAVFRLTGIQRPTFHTEI